MTSSENHLNSSVVADRPASPGALTALRQATSLLHAALDSQLPLARADAGFADYLDHVRHVGRWLAHLASWERAASAQPERAERLARYDALLQRIDADLAEAGEPAVERGVEERAPDGHAEPGYRWGIDYVVEGSQLGGAMLHRRFSKALAPHALRYLQGEAAGPGPRWRAFLATLEAAVHEPASIDAACRGASDAFEALMHSFGVARVQAGAPAAQGRQER